MVDLLYQNSIKVLVFQPGLKAKSIPKKVCNGTEIFPSNQ